MTAKALNGMHGAVSALRQDGALGLLARLRLRDAEDYEDWCEERDMVAIIAVLRRLSERQLERIGMSHATLALDVEDLVLRAERDRTLTDDVLRIVEGDAPPRMMAAE